MAREGLRKRPAAPPSPPAPKKRAPSKSKAKKDDAPKADEVEKPEPEEAPAPAPVEAPSAPVSKGGAHKIGDSITLEGFGGEVETNEGEKTTLAKLVESSKSGVVLFTYPKASTPGCTTQVCLFRDSYEPLTATGFSIYGLSNDSPKANTTFKTKQKLPYPLLCDQSVSLIAAIGLKKGPKGTTRGVFVVNKEGKVLAAEPGGPQATVDVVKKLVDNPEADDVKKAEETAAKDE